MVKKETSNYKSLISLFSIFILLFFISKYCYSVINDGNNINDHMTNSIRSKNIIKHTEKLIEIGNSKVIYEEGRSLAREYIRDYLVDGGIPKDNIIWNHFEWSERRAEGKNITTTTWTGINIIIWINSTAAESSTGNDKIRIVGSNYDTKYWGANSTAGAHDSLSGTGLLMEEAIEFHRFQEEESKRQGKPNDTPFMFILFDQEKPGSLGSRSFVNNQKIEKMSSQSMIAYFLNVDAIGGGVGSKSIIQTFPYEHKHQTIFTPRWLVDTMVRSAYQVNPKDGITLGSSNVGRSLMYQAHRYHLHSIPYLGDEGPFSWAGVDSLLITDVDFFYCNNGGDICNPNHNQLTDQPSHLDPDILKETADIVYQFLLNTRSASSIPRKDYKNYSTSPIVNLLLASWEKLLNLFFSGNNQYLFIGPIQFAYFQLVLIILFLLLFIYFTTFKKYRELVLQYEKLKYQKRKRIYRLKKASTNDHESTSEIEDNNSSVVEKDDEILSSNSSGSSGSSMSKLISAKTTAAAVAASSASSTNSNNNSSNTQNSLVKNSVGGGSGNVGVPNFNSSFFDSIRGHRILFLHLLTLAVISFIDTVYSFEIICLGFLSLSTFRICKYNINLLTGFISSAFCTNFIYKDITQIFIFGKKGNGQQELFLNILLGIYIVHSILLVIYGYDYGRKKAELSKFENKDN